MSKKLKLYAIVIGRKGQHQRYVTTNTSCKKNCLAVFEEYTEARKERKQIIEDCSHKCVFIIPFEQVVK